MNRDEYSLRLKFEHELINRRVTWLLTSQGLMFTAYGVVLKPPAQLIHEACFFRQVVTWVGATTAFLIFLGILTSHSAKICTWRDFQKSCHPDEQFWVRTRITYSGFVPELALPLALATAWMAVLTHDKFCVWWVVGGGALIAVVAVFIIFNVHGLKKRT